MATYLSAQSRFMLAVACSLWVGTCQGAEDQGAPLNSQGVNALGELERLTAHLEASIQIEEKAQDDTSRSSGTLCFQGPWQLETFNLEPDWDKIPPAKRSGVAVEVVR